MIVFFEEVTVPEDYKGLKLGKEHKTSCNKNKYFITVKTTVKLTPNDETFVKSCKDHFSRHMAFGMKIEKKIIRGNMFASCVRFKFAYSIHLQMYWENRMSLLMLWCSCSLWVLRVLWATVIWATASAATWIHRPKAARQELMSPFHITVRNHWTP